MTDELIEKVARAICRADGKDPDGWQTVDDSDGTFYTTENWKIRYHLLAIKAIEAMK